MPPDLFKSLNFYWPLPLRPLPCSWSFLCSRVFPGRLLCYRPFSVFPWCSSSFPMPLGVIPWCSSLFLSNPKYRPYPAPFAAFRSSRSDVLCASLSTMSPVITRRSHLWISPSLSQLDHLLSHPWPSPVPRHRSFLCLCKAPLCFFCFFLSMISSAMLLMVTHFIPPWEESMSSCFTTLLARGTWAIWQVHSKDGSVIDRTKLSFG